MSGPPATINCAHQFSWCVPNKMIDTQEFKVQHFAEQLKKRCWLLNNSRLIDQNNQLNKQCQKLLQHNCSIHFLFHWTNSVKSVHFLFLLSLIFWGHQRKAIVLTFFTLFAIPCGTSVWRGENKINTIVLVVVTFLWTPPVIDEPLPFKCDKACCVDSLVTFALTCNSMCFCHSSVRCKLPPSKIELMRSFLSIFKQQARHGAQLGCLLGVFCKFMEMSVCPQKCDSKSNQANNIIQFPITHCKAQSLFHLCKLCCFLFDCLLVH